MTRMLTDLLAIFMGMLRIRGLAEDVIAMHEAGPAQQAAQSAQYQWAVRNAALGTPPREWPPQ